ncbi:acylneuraminate cytidylyltransferase family protein [Candidatus Riflebacteria bacterium]
MCAKKILALIPARGGSKGIPGKNLINFLGKPLIYHTIEAAQNSAAIDRILVTTDSAAIAAEVEKCGLNVPFLRPADLATDGAKVLVAVVHALKYLEEEEEYRPDGVLLLQPTSPLRTVDDIEGAAQLFISEPDKAVVSITKLSQVAAHLLIPENGRFKQIVAEDPRTPRQKLTPCYYLNGAIFLAPTSLILDEGSFYKLDFCNFFEMQPGHSVDIDEPFDLKLAEWASKEGLW